MLITDKYAYSSNLAKIEPLPKVIFTFVMLMLCLFLNSVFVSIFLLFVSAIFTIYTNKYISLIKYLKFMAVPIGFLLMGILPVLIVFDDNSLFFIIKKYNIGISSHSIDLSINLFFRAISAVSITYFLALSTPMIYFFESLYKFKLPESFINLMELIYRYIFILIDEAASMYKAQQLRFGYVNFKTSIMSISELAAMLFIRAYKRAGLSYQALLSRGYNGNITTINSDYDNGKYFYLYIILFTLCSVLIKIITKGVVIWKPF